MNTDYLAMVIGVATKLFAELSALRTQPLRTVTAQMPIYVLDDVRSMPSALMADEAHEARREWMIATGRWKPGPVEVGSDWRAGELLLFASQHLISEGRRLGADPALVRTGLTRVGLVFREHASAVGRDVADSDAEIAATFRIAAAWLVDSRKGAAA